jgi:hypothetical protein
MCSPKSVPRRKLGHAPTSEPARRQGDDRQANDRRRDQGDEKDKGKPDQNDKPPRQR